MDEEWIRKKQAVSEVRQMAYQFADLYFTFCQQLRDALGEPRAYAIARETLLERARERAQAMVARAEEQKLERSWRRIHDLSDVPYLGWVADLGREHCPYGAAWNQRIERNPWFQKFACLYCDVTDTTIAEVFTGDCSHTLIHTVLFGHDGCERVYYPEPDLPKTGLRYATGYQSQKEPLLLRACQGGQFGRILPYTGGTIYEAGFIYLSGQADESMLTSLAERWPDRMFICLSGDWEDALVCRYPNLVRVVRYQMAWHPSSCVECARRIPSGYALCPFDESAFAIQPFSHGSNYKSFSDFQAHGAGAVVWHDGQIVASASSFLTYENELEVDLSVSYEHRKRGLGIACAQQMLLDCAQRGLLPHWDAQNAVSRHIAESLGYTLEYAYPAYAFRAPEPLPMS